VKCLTATEVARNFSQILDDVEESHEEVVIVRNHRMIARIIPEPEEQNALEVLGDLYRTLEDETADALFDAPGKETQAPWMSYVTIRLPDRFRTLDRHQENRIGAGGWLFLFVHDLEGPPKKWAASR
jgi:antitoxin (DNA-binding transcriptional repressor) of toxin-antitoxin stability system